MSLSPNGVEVEESGSNIDITEATARGLPETIKNLKVVDSRTYELMANGVLLLRKAKKFFEARAEPRIKEARELLNNLRDDLKKDLEPIEAAQKYGDDQLSAWDTALERVFEAFSISQYIRFVYS